MFTEFLLTFQLAKPFEHMPKIDVKVCEVVEMNYTNTNGIVTSLDEPVEFIREHPHVGQWFDRWTEAIQDAKFHASAIPEPIYKRIYDSASEKCY